MVSVGVKGHICDLSTDVYGQLEPPEGKDGFGTAAAGQFLALVANVIDQLLTKLAWETR